MELSRGDFDFACKIRLWILNESPSRSERGVVKIIRSVESYNRAVIEATVILR